MSSSSGDKEKNLVLEENIRINREKFQIINFKNKELSLKLKPSRIRSTMEKHISDKKKTRNATQKSILRIQHTNKTEDTFNETILRKKQENIFIETPANKTKDISAHVDKEANDKVTKIFTPKQATSKRLHNKSYARTLLETNIIEYTWEINNIMTIFKIRKELFSPMFPETSQYSIKLTFDIDKLEITKSILRVYLLTKRNFQGACDVCIVHPDFYKVEIKSTSGLISNMTLLYETTLESLEKYIIHDKIVMYFEIEFLHKSITQHAHVDMMLASTALYERLNDFKRPIVNFKPGEVITFKIKEERYNLPKKVLYATKSTYFKNICDKIGDTEDTIEVEIDEMPAPFKQMLSFLSSGIILDSFNYHMLRDLLMIAHKYDVQALKTICEFHLIRIINIENFVDLMQLARSCEANTLKTHASLFIKIYLKNIARIKEFQYLSQNDLDEIIKLAYQLIF